jgi:hypothetical protein
MASPDLSLDLRANVLKCVMTDLMGLMKMIWEMLRPSSEEHASYT